MTLQTERLERELNCSYQAEPLDDSFLSIIKASWRKPRRTRSTTFGTASGCRSEPATGLWSAPRISRTFPTRTGK